MSAVRISYLSINCTDRPACRSFHEALGITFVEEEHPGVPLHLSGEIGGAVLELHGPAARGGAVGPGFRLASRSTTSGRPWPRSSPRVPCSNTRPARAAGGCVRS